jgi:hypothetical protein
MEGKQPVTLCLPDPESKCHKEKKTFSLTLEEFKYFCYRYKYIGKKGRTKTGYGVDREREEDGYTLDNMRLKKNGNNTRKYKAYDLQHRTAVTVTVNY